VGKRIQPPPAPPPDSGKGKKLQQRSPEKELVTALLAPVEDSRALMQVVLTLPKAHVRVLDTEAAMLGLRRYQFVELLFLSELGQAILTRPSYMQSYQFVRSEIGETQRVLIYFRPEVSASSTSTWRGRASAPRPGSRWRSGTGPTWTTLCAR